MKTLFIYLLRIANRKKIKNNFFIIKCIFQFFYFKNKNLFLKTVTKQILNLSKVFQNFHDLTLWKEIAEQIFSVFCSPKIAFPCENAIGWLTSLNLLLSYNKEYSISMPKRSIHAQCEWNCPKLETSSNSCCSCMIVHYLLSWATSWRSWCLYNQTPIIQILIIICLDKFKFNSHYYNTTHVSNSTPYKKGSWFLIPSTTYPCNRDRIEDRERDQIRHGGLYSQKPICIPCSLIPFLHSSSFQLHHPNLIRKHQHYFSHNQQTVHQNFMQFNHISWCLLQITLLLCLQGPNQPPEARQCGSHSKPKSCPQRVFHHHTAAGTKRDDPHGNINR